MKLKAIFLFAFVCCGYIVKAQTTITVSADDKAANPTISKYIYSHFAEHLGHGIMKVFMWAIHRTYPIHMVYGMM
jgi:alpha-N-arabinofuranosidase